MDISTQERVKHYQRSIQRALLDKDRLLYCIGQLSRLPVTVLHLEVTGIGRTVNSLRKLEDGVGDAAKVLVSKWKNMVSNTRSSNDEDEACVPDAPESYESPDCDSETESTSHSHNEPEALRNPAPSPIAALDITNEIDDYAHEPVYDSSNNDEAKDRYKSKSSGSKRSSKYLSGKDKSSNNDIKLHEKNKYSSNSGPKDKYEPLQVSKDSESSENRKKDKNKYEYSSYPSSSSSFINKDNKNSEERKRKQESNSDEDGSDRKKRKESSSEDEEEENEKKNLVIYDESEEEEQEEKEDIEEEEEDKEEEDEENEQQEIEEKNHKEIMKLNKESRKESSLKGTSHSDKSKSKEKHSSSSHSKTKSHEFSDKSRKDKKHSSTKSHEHEKEEKNKSDEHCFKEFSKSPSSYSSSSSKDKSKEKNKEKSKGKHNKERESDSKDRKGEKEKNSDKVIKDDRGKCKDTKERKEHKENKDHKNSHKDNKEHKKDKDHKETKEHKKERKNSQNNDGGIDGNSGTSFAEALGMCTIPTSSKKKKESTSSSLPKPITTSFGDALSMCTMPPPSKKNKGSTSLNSPQYSKSEQPSSSSSSSSPSTSLKNKSSSKIKCEPPDSPESLPLLSSNVKLEPLSKINEEVDLTSTLPEPSPHYRPLPQVNHMQRRLDEDQMLSQVIYAKNQRTKVYSGNKTGYTTVPTLSDMSIRVLIENIDALEFTGGVPYYIIKPVLERATPDQLFMLEHHNPYLIEDTDPLWQFHCNKDFRTKLREEHESWRAMYLRCLDEREAKLKALTANIKQSIDKSAPVRSTKLAYVDHVVKPPRSVQRQQVKYGTANATTKSSDLKKKLIAAASGPSGSGIGSAERISVPPPPAARIRQSATAVKKTKAPLMAKALQAIKGRYKR